MQSESHATTAPPPPSPPETHKYLHSDKIQVLHLLVLSFFKERRVTPVVLVTTSTPEPILDYLKTAPFQIDIVSIAENAFGSVTSELLDTQLTQFVGRVCCACLTPFNIWNGSINNLLHLIARAHKYNVPVLVDVPQQTPWFTVTSDLYDILWHPVLKYWHIRTQLVEDYKLREYGPEIVLTLRTDPPPRKRGAVLEAPTASGPSTTMVLDARELELLGKFAALQGPFEYYGYDPGTHSQYIVGVRFVLMRTLQPVQKKIEQHKVELHGAVYLHLPLTQKSLTLLKQCSNSSP